MIKLSTLRRIGTPYEHPSEESLRIEELLNDLNSPEVDQWAMDPIIIAFCDEAFRMDTTPNIKFNRFLEHIKTLDLDPRLRQKLNKVLATKYFRAKALTFLNTLEQAPDPQGWPTPSQVNYAETAITNARNFGAEVEDLEMRYKAVDIPHKPATITPAQLKTWQFRNKRPVRFITRAVNTVLRRAA